MIQRFLFVLWLIGLFIILLIGIVVAVPYWIVTANSFFDIKLYEWYVDLENHIKETPDGKQ